MYSTESLKTDFKFTVDILVVCQIDTMVAAKSSDAITFFFSSTASDPAEFFDLPLWTQT